ncbi:MAG: DNA mismatch endonuclease Vsr [Elusimicrobia bacterium]|nr:DNA mismatch endonuclease Vsr [Elusimicrobiota bacterium]
MARIKAKNTKPEISVRKVLSKLGAKYRLHNSKLAGKPDIVIAKTKKIIFINGCFWHQHKNCKKQAMPKANKKYWKPKLQKNIEKQERDIKLLKKQGWKVYKIWECQTNNEDKLTQKISKIL